MRKFDERPSRPSLKPLRIEQKKAVISRLGDVYLSTNLSREQASRIRAGVAERLFEDAEAPRGFSWGWVAVPLGAIIIVLTVWDIFFNNQSNNAIALLDVSSGTVQLVDSQGNLLGNRDFLHAGAEVHTREDSRAELVVNDHRVTVTAASGLRLARLENSQLVFEVTAGESQFDIKKLREGHRLQVLAGDVSVEVVGTRFAVRKDEDCVNVTVTEGRVKTVHQRHIRFVAAGEGARFCDNTEAVRTGQVPGAPKLKSASGITDNSLKSPEISDEQVGRLSVLPSDPDADGIGERNRHRVFAENSTGAAADTSQRVLDSDEELLFENAHKALTKGALAPAEELFQRYMVEYSGGMFAEDARFRLVRIAFRQKDLNGVLQRSEAFMAAHGASGHRMTEVRILRAQALISLGRAGEAMGVLSALIGNLQRYSARYQHQITALQFTAACAAGDRQQCTHWSTLYAQQYPEGAFIKDARKNAK
ncbi:MAG: FecR domain-containing protein [Deltaproteobacteria bacterium]|nr:FecR domain-containing protein [Deltaproteobacteria bacterium]MBN2673938.1 FecR domain-containing protein [Deltaproteobacteria bacterium]